MKNILCITTVCLLCGLPAGPVAGQEACEFGPYYMTVSNTQGCVPDGDLYAGVSIDTCEDTLQALRDDAVCGDGYRALSLITVEPNEAVLIPGSNFGIQRFGLNYRGNDPHKLDPVVVQLNGSWIVQSGWRVKRNFSCEDDACVETSGPSFGPFGVFIYDESTTGKNRQNPLQIVLCYAGERTDISVYDFYVVNEDDYMFAAHIADFIGRSCDSAFFALPVPVTLVELADFRAVGLVNNVLLQWTTAAELENAGFNLYRADSEDGEYVRINAKLIPTKGSPINGATYRYLDTTVQRGKTYFYLLEDVDLNGVATVHTAMPISPRFVFRSGR